MPLRKLLRPLNPSAFLLTGLLGATTGCLGSPLLQHSQADSRPKLQTPAIPPSCAFRFSRAALCAELSWTREPSEDETGEFELRFWDFRTATEHGPYVAPTATVAAKLWMPSMGHGSAPIRVRAATDAAGASIPGVYRATGVSFSMPGEWELWIQLKNGSQIVEQAKLDLRR
jgi:hypothetical protein